MKTFFEKIYGRSKRAETILEVIVAIFVVALGSTAATSLVVDAMRSNGLSRDNLIAMNLAVEGQEALRNIRDTNWLKFSYNRDDCWNMMPGESICDPDNLIDAGPSNNGAFYAPFLNTTTMEWDLVNVDALALDLSDSSKHSGNENYRLYVADADPGSDSDGDGIENNDQDLFVAATSGLTDKTATKFYRMVKINYPTANPLDTQDEMTVTSVVQWDDRGAHQVKLVSKLTDYLKIKVN